MALATVMCDFCPAAFHPKCLGFKDADEMVSGSKMGWSCPHHECDKCGRKAAAAGGLLFRCSVCSFASCEDCLPADSARKKRWHFIQMISCLKLLIKDFLLSSLGLKIIAIRKSSTNVNGSKRWGIATLAKRATFCVQASASTSRKERR